MIKIKALPAGVRPFDVSTLIATGFGSGRLSPAPGTWGTLVAWVLGVLCAPEILGVFVVIGFFAGLWAARQFEQQSHSHDSGMIVIDEFVGVWIAMLFAPAHFVPMVLAFFLFRGFDILKPWPISWMDKKIDGAFGVMIDDVAAGLIAGACVYGVGSWIQF